MAPPPPSAEPNPLNAQTRFFGSQIGGRSAINYGYTDMPWKLMTWDVYHFFRFFWALPYIVWPLSPADSAELSELSLTLGNVWCIVIHVVLCIVQLAGIAALPSLLVLPVWLAVLLTGLFLLINTVLCLLLNGKGVEYHSEPKYAPELPEHAHEQWIYINGVAAGSGIVFDVFECLLQRNWGYATKDVRVCYQIIKEKIYNPQYSKVIFVLHSQGGIEGSLILDWLLQELPQDLLSKLEVYTFGNAANHFNNPHRHIRSQTLAKHNPVAASIDSTRLAAVQDATEVPRLRRPQKAKPRPSSSSSSSSSDTEPYDKPPAATTNSLSSTHPGTVESVPPITSSTTSPHPSHLSDRAIGHIEHYAHTTDFVALWGVLHFATSAPTSPFIPRFIGRVFARASPKGGHQMVQHYLDGMFPLRRDPQTGRLVRRENGVPWGAEEEGNEFMEIQFWRGGSKGGKKPTVKVKVKELSRLWQYRNGKSPEETLPWLARGLDGAVRHATL
ncbi:hypothetical protein NEMBOFW57_003885 [Staphylotrichum longicolle]|uniref:Alpha/beta-hydrolase n=1 Tax=Staphylotrichum longicolle TaxID=669026 RepID=A0AAD4F8N1_9PEZI|nr:hypothetical protein NEMBOFW57_003885 [Staphylotrichum longicolle]